MRVLFSTCSAPHYMAPPPLADEQVNCGPFFQDREIGGRFVSLATPKGEYDLATVAARLPSDQQPDAVVCLVDASWFNQPKNLAAFKCPRVVLVADTHHMSKPITGMIRYLQTESYDRIVFLYTRHHLDFFRAAGLKNIFWFPGLTFPHSDATVRAARQERRENRIALIGQAGNLHQRRLKLAGALAGAGLPLVFREGSQRESLDFYGASALGFNATANADLNLRAFETMAAGTALLMDRLAPASGLTQLWTEGREFVGYDDERELVAQARQLVADSAAARRIGEAAAHWFDAHFHERRRRELFAAIVTDGRADPMFELPATPALSVTGFGGDLACYAPALGAYEYFQKLHSTEKAVRLLADDTVPADFARFCATLPRLHLMRHAKAEEPADCFITTKQRALALTALDAPRFWCWDATSEDVPELAARFKAAGLAQLTDGVALFGIPQIDAVPVTDRLAADARKLCYNCELPAALEKARRALEANPDSVEAQLVMAELALESGKPDLVHKLLRRTRQLAPDEPRIPLLELATRQEGTRQRPAERLLASAMRHLSALDLGPAKQAAARALKLDPKLPAAWYWLGQISLRQSERCADLAQWREFGAALKFLRGAAALAPRRADYWLELGLALRRGGLLREAAEALARAQECDPSPPSGWLALGEAWFAFGEMDRAADAFAAGLGHAPTDRLLLRWLGHARKRQGRLEEARSHHLRSFGIAGDLLGPGGWSGGKRRAVFLVQHGPAWTCTESVYRQFAADPAWEAVVVAAPYLHPFYNQAQDDTNAIFPFLDAQGTPYLKWDEFPLGPHFADVVFVQNPYDVTRPPTWHVPQLLRHGVRLAYLPYGLEIGGGERNNTMVMNLPLQQFAWMVFVRSERQKRSYADHCLTGNAHVVVTGHAKLDALRDLTDADTSELRTFAAGRRIVAWNPHFDIRLNGTRFGGGFSTFLRWSEFFLEEFGRRKDLALVMRPHPLFFGTLEDRGILTAGQIKAYLDRGCADGVMWVDRNPSHLPLFAAADAMMSDISSFVLEFTATGKPLLYLHNPHGLPLNDDAEFVHRYLDQAEREEQIVRFLDQVAAGHDPRRRERMAAYSEYLFQPTGGTGRAVKQAIEARLAAEEAAMAVEPLAAGT